MKPNKQPCCICKDHKQGQPFKIRDDIGREFLVSHICNCPYCGRFLAENYNMDVCAVCGEIIPEGRQVCPNCEKEVDND